MGLSDCFDDAALAGVLEDFDAVTEAERLAPVPAGLYVAELVGADFVQSGKGTPGYELAFAVAEGEHAGRKLWARYWMSAKALPLAKAELRRAGFANAAALRSAPIGARYKLRVTLRQGQDGEWHNEAKDVQPLGPEDGVAQGGAGQKEAGGGVASGAGTAVVPDGLEDLV